MAIQTAEPAIDPQVPILGEALQAFAELEPSLSPRIGRLGGLPTVNHLPGLGDEGRESRLYSRSRHAIDAEE